MLTYLLLCLDPFAVKRNVARTVNSQQMYEYILHCLKTTYKYFALPREACLSDFTRLSIHSQQTSQTNVEDSGPQDSDCIIEEEEDVKDDSDSDGEREKEKVDLGKSSLSEDEEDEEVATHGRHHLDSFTTEDEEIFPVDEISGEEILSDEEGPDLDTPGSNDEEGDVAPAHISPPPPDGTSKDDVQENKSQTPMRTYEFTRQAFTRGKVNVYVFIVPTVCVLLVFTSTKSPTWFVKE